MGAHGTLCRDEWSFLLLLHVAVLGAWLYSASRMSRSVDNFYKSYRILRDKGRIPGAPAWWVFGVVWTVIYILLVPAIFLFYYYDDACLFANANYDQSIELALWILILANLVLNKAWDLAISMGSLYYASLLAALLTLIVTLSAIAIAVLLYFLAADANVSDNLYFSAAVYSLYALWGIYATYLGFRHFSQLTHAMKKEKV